MVRGCYKLDKNGISTLFVVQPGEICHITIQHCNTGSKATLSNGRGYKKAKKSELRGLNDMKWEHLRLK